MFSNLKKSWLFWVTVVLLAVNIFLFKLDWQSSNRLLTLAMLDVGQGDSLFIESPTGTQVLFDMGPPHKAFGPLSRVMSPFDRSIDAVIITNPDADHIGGFLDILKTYKVGKIFESGTLTDSRVYQNLREEMKRQNIPDILAKRGMRLNMGGGVYIDILFPDRDVASWATNEGSVVARLTYGETSIMLTGDSTAKTEKIILSQNPTSALGSTILKVGHHGSRTSTTESFVKAINPEYALISVGKSNNYGHPHQDTVNTLAKLGVEILRTDILGTIIIKCDKIKTCKIN